MEKLEALDYYLRKTELDLEFFLPCRDINAMPNLLNFRVGSQSYKQFQLKLLQKEICHKKFDVRV